MVFRDLVALGCQTDVLLQDELDKKAKTIHERYVSTEIARGITPQSNAILVAWDDLPEAMRQSNRAQADHEPIKLATLKIAKDPATIEALAEAEHRRWMAERVLSGWRYGSTRDNPRKRHPSLKPYAEISEDVKQKDRDVVNYILACYECQSGNLDEAKRIIAAIVAADPKVKDQYLQDDDLKAIHDYIKTL